MIFLQKKLEDRFSRFSTKLGKIVFREIHALFHRTLTDRAIGRPVDDNAGADGVRHAAKLEQSVVAERLGGVGGRRPRERHRQPVAHLARHAVLFHSVLVGLRPLLGAASGESRRGPVPPRPARRRPTADLPPSPCCAHNSQRRNKL